MASSRRAALPCALPTSSPAPSLPRTVGCLLCQPREARNQRTITISLTTTMEMCFLVVIVRAGAVWSGVGTLAVALGGIAAPSPGSHSKGGGGVERGGDPCGRPGGIAAPSLGIIAISAVLLISRSPWGDRRAPLPCHITVPYWLLRSPWGIAAPSPLALSPFLCCLPTLQLDVRYPDLSLAC